MLRTALRLAIAQVNVLEPDLSCHPSFATVPYVECMLVKGEMLYIPRRWWHFVWAQTASLSISFWFIGR